MESTKNVQRLDTVYSASFIEDIQELVRLKQDGYAKRELVQKLCAKYGIAQETLYWRARSYFGKSLSKARWDYFEPSKEFLLELVEKCQTPQELRERLGMPNKQFAGIYDRVLGVSTFHAAKLLTLRGKVPKYTPSTKDNLALVAACKLGDASFALRCGNHSMRIEHSYAQKGWLETKRRLLVESFPWMGKSSGVKVTKRGTVYWYAGTFTSDKYNQLLQRPKEELVKLLTPLGIWVLYLDDGSYTVKPSVITFAVNGTSLGNALAEHLRTFGYDFTVEETRIAIKRAYDVKRFLRDFCEPFAHLTPECMNYKTIFGGVNV